MDYSSQAPQFQVFSTSFIITALVLGLIMVVAMWKIYQKAGRPGWHSIIPIYSLYALLKIIGRPGWWVILYFIPIVNLITSIVVYNDLSKRFGHGTGFTLGLIFLPFIFLPILGFGESVYQPQGVGPVPTPSTGEMPHTVVEETPKPAAPAPAAPVSTVPPASPMPPTS